MIGLPPSFVRCTSSSVVVVHTFQTFSPQKPLGQSKSFTDLGPRSLRFTTVSSFFSLETDRLIEAKFFVEPPWDGGMKVCSNGPGLITSMSAMPIYGKNLKNLLLWNQTADDLESWYTTSGTRVLPSLLPSRPSVRRPSSTIFKDLLLQNRLAYQSQMSYGASVGWGNESLFVGSGVTKMAATPIYCKNSSKFFISRTKGPMTLWLGM